MTQTEIVHSVWNSLLKALTDNLKGFYPSRGEQVAYKTADLRWRTKNLPRFDLCLNVETLQQVINNKYSEKKFDLAVMHIVQLILKNSSSNTGCVNGLMDGRIRQSYAKIYISFKMIYSTTQKEYALLTMSDDGNGFTFLACGKPSFREFEFHELVNVFKREIWLFLFIFMVLLSFFTATVVNIRIEMAQSFREKQVLRVDKLVSMFIQVSKALLEQGDPFYSNVAGSKRLRFSTGAFLLVAIVLSNA